MMRDILCICIVLTLTASTVADEAKKGADPQPIKVVTLDRKEPVTYEKDIAPILENKCAYCHSGAVKEAKFDMGTYEGLIKGGKRGAAIVPGKPDQSMLVKLSGRTMKPTMPPKSEEPLTPEELALIKLWIEQGAKAPASAVITKRAPKLGRL